MNPVKSTIDGIECLTLTRPNATKTVMILHGFGADMNDLASLHAHLDPDREFNWIFPNGIVKVPIGPHVSGRAWFPIRMAEIEAAAMRGEVLDLAETYPEGLGEAEKRIKSLINFLRIEPKNLILGGFSQGAMMTCQVALTMDADVGAMILFSGTCINLKVWQEQASRHKEIPFIQSHGKSDAILGFIHAQRLHTVLTASGLKGKFIPFGGGHEIPLPIIRETSKFLKGCI
jgi:phospholipase/carboxylesterase